VNWSSSFIRLWNTKIYSDFLKTSNLLILKQWNAAHTLTPLFYENFQLLISGGTQIFPEMLPKIYLKYLYKIETLVPLRSAHLQPDAAIPAPLPMLETLSKIFNGNAVKGRQQFAGGP